MKITFAIFLLCLFTVLAFGQNEQAPITEKTFDYKDWVHKNVQTDRDINLRKFTGGKKLVMVVYWAPWCPNWKYDAAFVQGLYDKYKGNGFDVIGVAEYDSLEKIKKHIEDYKLTFTNVYESQSTADREKTIHFTQRREAGDARKWGSPWYVFLEVPKLEPEGQIVMAKKVPVINGEMIRPEAEKFIQQKLGLSGASLASAGKDKIEACEPEKKIAELKKP